MDAIKVDTRQQSRYHVFDASGRLPLDITFGLYRHSPSDTDSRDLSFPVAGSALDISYGLAKGLLSLHEHDPSITLSEKRVPVDLNKLRSTLGQFESPTEWLTLPARGLKPARFKQETSTLYHYRINHDGPLASLLKPGRKYSIQFESRDLGVQKLIYGSQDDNITQETTGSAQSPYKSKLVTSKSPIVVGRARFTVVESLSWPPPVETRMQLAIPPSTSRDFETTTEPPQLQITITNKGSSPLCIQTQGHQRFLIPWGIFQPEDDGINDSSLRLADPKPSTSSLETVNTVTGEVFCAQKKRSGCAGLRAGKVDLRPKVDDLVVLEPNVPVARNIDITRLTKRLEDGDYRIRLRPKGCWWHLGKVKSDEGDDGKVPARLISSHQPSLVFETEDEVNFKVVDGKVMSKS